MRRLLALSLLSIAAACGDSTEPVNYGPPTLQLINGVTKPSGIVGMTVILEGSGLAESRYGKVYFRGTDGAALEASTSDWTNEYILATVPQGTATVSHVWVTTNWGTTDTLDFALISGNTFSPSNISWARTADLPRALQGLGAVYVPVESVASKAKYVFTLGGAADLTNIATTDVYRGTVQETGAIGAWTAVASKLPSARAYHGSAVATPYSSAMDTTGAAYLYVIGGVDSLGAPVRTVFVAPVGLDGVVGAWGTATELPAALRSPAATLYRGYLYVTGGAAAANAPQATGYRAKVNATGSLGSWEPLPALPAATVHHAMTNFGPYLYVVGGDTAAVDPASNASSGKETAAGYLGRIDMRDGTIPAWTALSTPAKARARHGLMIAGGTVVATSGMYSGQAGSSENTYASVTADGTLSSWAGATGGSTIQTVLGYSLYNAAAVSFADATGKAHVVVIGGANRSQTGRASAAVVYY